MGRVARCVASRYLSIHEYGQAHARWWRPRPGGHRLVSVWNRSEAHLAHLQHCYRLLVVKHGIP
jgi:hypothetical protein